MSAEEPSTPTRLGRYELIGQLATGGMAEIHLARLAGEAGFEKTVVVKRLLPELVASKAFVTMFLDEGKLVARIDHPNVCEVHELGREGSEYFLVMPYLDGVPATDFIARPRDPDRIAQLRVAAAIVVQACAGLHHAHELRGGDGESLGLVHRDVSPSNVFVTTAGVVKVLDFGVAKVRGAAAETEVGTIKGKTQYMAPEQLLGEPLDRRCDVFALGIVLYELATHQRLFKRASDYLAAKAVLEEEIPRADTTDPAVPRALADVIARALSRKREDRHATAQELAKAVDEAMAPHGGVATTAQIASALAEWHGEELSALRTRQRKVIEVARSATVPGFVDGAPTASLRARAAAASLPPPIEPVSSRRNGVWVVVALLALGGGGGAVYLATRSSPHTAAVADGRRLDAGSAARVDAVDANMAPDDANVAVDANVTIEAAGVEDTSIDMPDDRVHHAAKPGTISIDSNPFATIYVDGKPFGVTPILQKALPAGHHKLKAVLKDGRSKELKLEIPPGKAAKPVVLTW